MTTEQKVACKHCASENTRKVTEWTNGDLYQCGDCKKRTFFKVQRDKTPAQVAKGDGDLLRLETRIETLEEGLQQTVESLVDAVVEAKKGVEELKKRGSSQGALQIALLMSFWLIIGLAGGGLATLAILVLRGVPLG